MNTTLRMKMNGLAAMSAVALFVGSEAWAGDKNFTNGGATEEWTQGANWAGGTPPSMAATDDPVLGSAALSNAACYLGRVSGSETAEGHNLALGKVPGRSTLNIRGGILALSGTITIGNVAGSTGIVVQTGGVVTNSGVINIASGAGAYGSWTITGGSVSNATSAATTHVVSGGYPGSYGELLVRGGRFVVSSSSNGTFRLGNASNTTGRIEVSNGGYFEFMSPGANAALSIGNIINSYGEFLVTNGGTAVVSCSVNVATVSGGSTGKVTIASGGVFSNASTRPVTIGADNGAGVPVVVISNGVFHAEGSVVAKSGRDAVPADVGAQIELAGTQRVFRVGSGGTLTLGGNATTRKASITNGVRKVAGGVELLNTASSALVINNGSKIHLSFEQGPGADGDFWGLRWAGTNGYPVLTNYLALGRITVTNTMIPPFSTNTIGVYRADDNSCTYIGFKAVVPTNNASPSVNAGSPQTIQLPPGTATLNATILDDGMPIPPAAVSSLWTKVSGPGSVIFGNDAQEDTTATFDTAGTYVLQLWASDGALEASNTVTLTVKSNDAPVVSAGSDQSVTLAGAATLDGTVTDDGLPAPAQLTYQWSKISGPGTVTFANSNAVDTTATFDATGSYVLQLMASDGALSAADTVTVNIRDAVSLTAKADGAFNMATTWDPETAPMPGDTLNITAYTVTNLAANGVVGTVNLSASGTLWCASLGTSADPVAAGSTITVGAGGTLRLDLNNSVGCTNVNLSGGKVAFNRGVFSTASRVSVNGNSELAMISLANNAAGLAGAVHGTNRLTVTGSDLLSTAFGFGAGSTWTGAWDLHSSLRFDGSITARTVPGDVRVVAGKEMRFDTLGPHVFKGTRSGDGTNSAYANCSFVVGDGVGNGKLSPGDNGAGVVTFTSYTAGSGPVTNTATLTFNTNSVYDVDVAIGTSDCVRVVGVGPTNGIVRILSGSILTVHLPEPLGPAALDQKIIDTVNGAGGDGQLTGDFGVTNWVNATGWRNLALVKVGNDLHVQGNYLGLGTMLIVK